MVGTNFANLQKSTVSQVFDTTNNWTNAMLLVVAPHVLIHLTRVDFRKVFDSVSHVQLLHTFASCGIAGKLGIDLG